MALARDRLPPGIDAANMRPDRAAHTLGITRPIGVYVFEVVQLLVGYPARRAVGVWGQYKRNAVAPAAAHLGGEELRIDLIPLRLQEMFEPEDVGADDLEDGGCR